MPPQERRLSVRDVSRMLGIGESAVRERIYRGTLGAEKEGREWRIPEAALMESEGFSPGSGAVLRQLLVPILAQNVREIVEEVGEDLLRRSTDELGKAIGDTREQLGYERARREAAEELVRRLEADLERLRGAGP